LLATARPKEDRAIFFSNGRERRSRFDSLKFSCLDAKSHLTYKLKTVWRKRMIALVAPLLVNLVCSGYPPADDEILIPGQVQRAPLRAEEDREGALRRALLAAAHHFAEVGDVENLAGILENHPELVDKTWEQPGPPIESNSYTMLHRAAVGGHRPVADYLLSKGAKIDAVAAAGYTPLHLAAWSGKVNIVKLLIARGANVNAKTTALPPRVAPNPADGEKPSVVPAEPSHTAVELAAKCNHPNVVEYLRTIK
jgi:Ankyrin repeats (3 copies)